MHLPRAEALLLHRFSLFEKTTTVEVSFPPGVFCLAGANGLGKSTFLAAVNYAMTGVVAQPEREFLGVDDYYKRVRSYSETFFRGRIAPEDAEAAYVELTMRVGDRRYRLARGMFDSLALRELEITSVTDGAIVIAHDPELEPSDRHDLYTRTLVQDCGLENLAQLVFLQHFVVTFDERRDLLFWGSRTLPAALFVAFGLDPAKAKRADQLQETVRGAGSLSRNYSWQASDWRRQLDNLEKAADQVTAEDEGVGREHERLQREQDEASAEVQGLVADISAMHVSIAERSAQLRVGRNEYDQLWEQRLRGHGHPASHPVVTTSIADARCALCGTEGQPIADQIGGRIAAGHCPMCDTRLETTATEAVVDVVDLAAVDERILAHQDAIAAAEQTVGDLEGRLGRARERRDAAARAINEFELANEVALLRGRGELNAVAERYRAAMADQMQRKEEQLRRRDAARKELRTLQRELVASYSVAEEEFVPSFTRLAERFLGLDLDIELQTRQDDISLLLTVQGSQRRETDTLSESQRFFLDIALRMALVAQLSSSSGDAGALYVDTPEGSLDIAYEARAGDMFGTFARDGFGLIMTANINTSKLLERLARKCGHEYMTLERMTDWAILSEVQAEEESLFDEAFDEIEAALGEPDA